MSFTTHCVTMAIAPKSGFRKQLGHLLESATFAQNLL